MSWKQALRHVPTQQQYVKRVRKELDERIPRSWQCGALALPDEVIVDAYFQGYTVKEFVKEVLS